MIWRNQRRVRRRRTEGKKKGGKRAQRRIDRRRSRITKRFHRWREFPSFIGSSLKRISGKSHSGLMGDGRQWRTGSTVEDSPKGTSPPKTVNAVVRDFPFFSPLFLFFALNKLRSSTEALYVIHIFRARNAPRVPSARNNNAARNNAQSPNALTFRKLDSARWKGTAIRVDRPTFFSVGRSLEKDVASLRC